MEQYYIKIIRQSANGPLKVYSVELDGFQVGKLKSRSEVDIITNAGNHVLSFIWMGRVEKTIVINIPEGQSMTLINATLNIWSGKIELEIKKPIESTASSNVNLVYDNSKLALETNLPAKKKKFYFGCCIVLYVVFLIIGSVIFLAVMFGETSETVDDTNTESVKKVEVELTDEEKAKLEAEKMEREAECELEKATTRFSEGKYQTALEICNNIMETYPDTETARNMDNYINEQYSQYPYFTARQLMAEYEANIVNADKEFTDKVMIVSGTVSRIDKTNNGKNLCVLLNSGTYFWSVQLNFDTSQTDAVSALKEGDSVKVVGKCTGKNGKYFVIFDGENVMITNCLLIK